MPKVRVIIGVLLIGSAFCAVSAQAAAVTVSGVVTDDQGIAVSGAVVELRGANGQAARTATTDTSGNYHFSGVESGAYAVSSHAEGLSHFAGSVQVTEHDTDLPIQLAAPVQGKEMVMKVEAKRQLIHTGASSSATTTTQEDIATLPQGSDISLPKLLETTNPGVVAGPFNQTFIRGNHANVQYQIDGVQLPDSVSGTFAEAFSTRNIDHMDFISGGLPAEYGERLAAVVSITTKTGPETPNGLVELNYGSYDTFNPQAMYGGSNAAGDWHYFFSTSYSRTDRGIDTPQPSGTALNQQSSGGTDAVHDMSNGNNQFAKIDWLPNNSDKISFVIYQNYNFYQIPNFPSSFSSSDPYFGANAAHPYTDNFGNTTNGATPVFNYAPATTNDRQTDQDAYGQVVWRHTFSERSFLQIAPYWKYSKIRFDGDPAGDLATATNPNFFIPGSTPSSFGIDRHVNNAGVKTDYSMRPDDQNLVKIGFQLLASQANDAYNIQSAVAGPTLAGTSAPSAFAGGGTDRGYFEDLYAQDDFTLNKQWSLNAGLRYTATQFQFPNDHSSAYQWQPRVGVNFMPDELTKLHVYYGRLFQPAPLEDLREAFDNVNGTTTASFYDIKPETDNYYEFGVDRQVMTKQLATVNVYYKTATNMLDDTQLLNTAIATPFNYADGYAYGLEASVKGHITPELSEYFNYSYDIAKGENINGGTFAINPQSIPANTHLYLDHVQVHTANTGLTYAKDQYFGTVQGLFGSGLRTGPFNTNSLPSHFSFNLTGGYDFAASSWLSKWKVQADILNIFNNVYPITIANGFNGSHYAAGREFFIRLTKEL